MRDSGEQDPPGAPSHRAVGDRGEAIRDHEAYEHEQRPEDDVHAHRLFPPPVHDRRFACRRVDDDDQ